MVRSSLVVSRLGVFLGSSLLVVVVGIVVEVDRFLVVVFGKLVVVLLVSLVEMGLVVLRLCFGLGRLASLILAFLVVLVVRGGRLRF